MNRNNYILFLDTAPRYLGTKGGGAFAEKTEFCDHEAIASVLMMAQICDTGPNQTRVWYYESTRKKSSNGDI